MENSVSNSDPYRNSSGSSSNSRRYGMHFSAANFIQAPLSALLEYSGILRTRSNHQETEGLINGGINSGFRDNIQNRLDDPAAGSSGGEVSIRIIGAGEQEHVRLGTNLPSSSAVGREANSGDTGISADQMAAPAAASASDRQGDAADDSGNAEGLSSSSSASISGINLGNGSTDGEAGNVVGGNTRDTSYQRYDIQQVARWIEQILPFSLLLLVVFIRQHLQGFFVTIWIAAVMFKSNDILRKQTALKGERKISLLIGIMIVFMFHVVGVYWWYRNEDLLYPLIMLPPKAIPPFWHAIFMIMVNDTMVRQAAMVFKCILLMYYKNSRGRNYRKQGQMLTLVEYLLLLYRALLPTPVWYRFFLNKEYGSLFSSLTTGLYLTFKLTSVVEKVQSFFAALKALSRKEVHYGSYATSEQVNAAGDLCAICQEKMHAPILLRCKHIFCEDCVSEWFERERTCPLCRALVKPADLRSFGDGSTSLFFQLF
ncbi:RING finger and transmembrane domain-containing protein 2-like [Telopea speciosissima]|uniref:RING finger and transmembrane domain-containing protein 2-like n=1 Tax=Telopea speciosissima TaxID=54955 RepID=UPI001CC7EECC|nr:RING finger and transmembrane domain-containing protein 2-like [Telopea speciosissima]